MRGWAFARLAGCAFLAARTGFGGGLAASVFADFIGGTAFFAGAFLAGTLAAAFLAVVFLAGAFFTGAWAAAFLAGTLVTFLAGAFFAGAFFAAASFAGAFFGGADDAVDAGLVCSARSSDPPLTRRTRRPAVSPATFASSAARAPSAAAVSSIFLLTDTLYPVPLS
ncbi:hypothetical protein AU193_21130 [Mycobacterium sp. GA-1285]|nr:hypothetical protein AU193_21130 [Mycobacterium sp. GA-1285]